MNLQHTKVHGTFTGSIIRIISRILANEGTVHLNCDLRGCGKFTLADDLSDIQDITHVDLSFINSLEGDICCFANCKKLKILKLSRTKVQGDVSCFANHKELKNLTLGNTKVHGDIRVFEHTQALQQLDLTDTRVTGDICVFENTPALEECSLGATNVSGDTQALKRMLPKCNVIC